MGGSGQLGVVIGWLGVEGGTSKISVEKAVENRNSACTSELTGVVW